MPIVAGPRRGVVPAKYQWQCASWFGGLQPRVSLGGALSIATGNVSPLSERQLVDLQIFKDHVRFTHTTSAQNLYYK